jgi:hypothetical protein
MKKWLIYLLLLISPVVNKAVSDEPNSLPDEKFKIFADLQLSQYGLTEQVFQLALKGYRALDVTKKTRLYVVDLVKKMLLFNTYVAHGRNTGDEYARNFSNETGSLKSSLGFYITENPSIGSKVGPSLIIKGIEKGFNDHALQREIIMHGASYATEAFIRKNGRLGRSFGCPSVPPELIRPISETIKGGTCLFIYSPDNNYLCKSSLLQQSEISKPLVQHL